MNTGRICPLGHNLPTSDIQSFHSDCGPLVAPYTDFKNSCVPGMPPKVCGRLWTISGPLAEKIPPFQVLFLFFFFLNYYFCIMLMPEPEQGLAYSFIPSQPDAILLECDGLRFKKYRVQLVLLSGTHMAAFLSCEASLNTSSFPLSK